MTTEIFRYGVASIRVNVQRLGVYDVSFSKEVRFRAAEKLVRVGVNSSFEEVPDDLRLVHAGFEPLLIHRPVRLYQRALGLKPGFRSKPAQGFLSEVLGHHRGHDAILRDALGESLFKSLQHLRNGTHELSNTTLKRLAQKLGVSIEDLARLRGRPERAVLGYLHGMSFWHEFVPNAYALLRSDCSSMAQHCAERYSVACQWWQTECEGFDAPECVFLDRILIIATGIVMLPMHCSEKPPGFWFSNASPSEMSHPDRHPMGNWLQRICSLDGFDDLQHWCKQKTADFEITHEKLRKWSAGTQCMPLHQAMLLVGAMHLSDDNFETALTSQHWAARLVSFVQEFVLAACPEVIDRETVRRRIHARLTRMEAEMLEASLNVPRITIDRLFSHMGQSPTAKR